MAAKNQRRVWRPSKRNVVMRKALARRPDRDWLLESEKDGCPLCGAGVEHLNLASRDHAHKSTPYALQYLGIKADRWHRSALTINCGSCGSAFSGGALHDWNLACSARRYADFGITKFPLPHRVRHQRRKRGTKGLTATLRAQIHPRKQHLVNLKIARGVVNRAKRLARLHDWTFIKQGLAPPYRD